jgi:hypothetical protein
MLIQDQTKNKIESYLESEYEGNYGVAIDSRSSEKTLEVYITYSDGSSVPDTDELASDLNLGIQESFGMLEPETIEAEHNHEENRIDMKIKEAT